jgi:hypothetical protein
MPLQIFKLVMTATTTTGAYPTSKNYFYTRTSAINTTALTLAVGSFQTDAGSTTTAFQTVSASNGYSSLYINGELQEAGIFKATATKLTFTTGTAITCPANGVIALKITKFAPVSTTGVSG